MANLIIEAVLRPFRDAGHVARLFWSYALVSLIFWVASGVMSRRLENTNEPVFWIVESYLIAWLVGTTISVFVLVFPLVRWHRFVVDGPSANAPDFAAATSYLVRWFALNLRVAVVALVLIFGSLSAFVASSDEELPNWFIGVLSALIVLALVGVVAFLCQRLICRMLASAVETDPTVRSKATKVSLPNHFGAGLFTVGILVLTPTLLEIIASIVYGYTMPEGIWSDALWWLTMFYEVIVFATFISLVYRDHIRPQLTD